MTVTVNHLAHPAGVLTQEQLDAAYEALEAMRRHRSEQVSELTEAVHGGDLVARAQLAAARDVLGEVQVALDRLAAGTYGRCTSCDVEIPFERLELLPHAATCVACRHALGRVR